MQTKKRAKAVKFGKKSAPVKEKKEEPVIKEEPTEEVVIEEVTISEVKETPVESVAEKKPESPEPTTTRQEQDSTTSTASPAEETPAPPQSEPEQPSEASGESGDTYVETEVKKNLLRYFVIIAVISFIIGLISMAGISLLFQKSPFGLPLGSSITAQVSPSPSPTDIPSPTPAVVNLTKYNIEVLNGSETSGAASKLKTELTTAGFKVISAGNADRSDYTDTVIFAKKEVDAAFLNKLKAELKKTYTLAEDAKIPSLATNEADIIITIGSNTASQ